MNFIKTPFFQSLIIQVLISLINFNTTNQQKTYRIEKIQKKTYPKLFISSCLRTSGGCACCINVVIYNTNIYVCLNVCFVFPFVYFYTLFVVAVVIRIVSFLIPLLFYILLLFPIQLYVIQMTFFSLLFLFYLFSLRFIFITHIHTIPYKSYDTRFMVNGQD